MKNIFYVALTVLSLTGYAQSGETLTISLQQALDLGLKNRFDIQANKYNLTLAENSVSKSKKEWIPDISAPGNVRYSPQLQATLIPSGFFGSSAELVALGAKSTSIFGLDLNQPIFKPGISTDIKIARNNVESEKNNIRQNESNIKEEIAKAYLNVILRQLQTKIAHDDEQRYQEYKDVAEGKLKIGTLVENDYLKAKLDYENAKVETLKAQQNYELALNNLKYQINMPNETVLTLSDSLHSSNFSLQTVMQEKEAGNNRTEIEQLLLRQKDNGLQVSKYRQNALPSLSLYANYSQQFLYNNFDYGLHQWWSPFSYVGLRLNVPITGNVKNYNSIQEYHIRSVQTDYNLKQRKAAISYEIQKASTELNNALQNMETTKNNYDLSKVIYESQRKQYNLGTLLYSSLLDTEKSLSLTEQNYIRSAYDYLVASINYQKALGNY